MASASSRAGPQNWFLKVGAFCDFSSLDMPHLLQLRRAVVIAAAAELWEVGRGQIRVDCEPEPPKARAHLEVHEWTAHEI